MLVVSTDQIANKEITESLGSVHGEVIIGANVFRDIFAGFRDFFGGRSRSYERALEQARETAMQEIKENAKLMGAHAVVDLTIDYEVIGSKGSMLMVGAYGTAVKIHG